MYLKWSRFLGKHRRSTLYYYTYTANSCIPALKPLQYHTGIAAYTEGGEV